VVFRLRHAWYFEISLWRGLHSCPDLPILFGSNVRDVRRFVVFKERDDLPRFSIQIIALWQQIREVRILLKCVDKKTVTVHGFLESLMLLASGFGYSAGSWQMHRYPNVPTAGGSRPVLPSLRPASPVWRRIPPTRTSLPASGGPPSSDIVKPPPATRPQGKKRRIGGQPGHPRHQRPPFPPDQIDQTRLYTLARCPDCGGPLRPAPADARL